MSPGIHDLASRASVHAVLILALMLPAMVLYPHGAPFFGMFGSTFFTFSSAIGLVFRPRYLRALGALVLFWPLVLFVSMAVADASVHGMRDDAMAFLLPFMLFLPAVLGASFFHWLRRRLSNSIGSPDVL